MPLKRLRPRMLTPSKDVRIEPKRATDGSMDTWEVVIGSGAIQKLAKAAGVAEEVAAWLYEPLKFMMFSLQCEVSDRPDRSPSGPTLIKYLQSVQSASCKLKALLQPRWVTREMRIFEDGELRQQTFGTRGLPTLEPGNARAYMKTSFEIDQEVLGDMQAVDRLVKRSSAMLDWLRVPAATRQRRPGSSGALDLSKRYIANCALDWWMHFGNDDERSDKFIAFADQLYRLAGFTLKPPAIRGQLTSAVGRRNAKASEIRTRS